MRCSGLLILTSPTDTASCSAALRALGNVEIHHLHTASGRIIATQRVPEGEDQAGAMERIRAVPEVRAVESIYLFIDTPGEPEVQGGSWLDAPKRTGAGVVL